MIYFVCLLLLEIIVFFVVKRSSIILLKKDVFPVISTDLIGKYNAFDSHLGWTNRQSSVKYEVSQSKQIEYTYDEEGGRSSGDLNDLPVLISTWGDSYCQCREVGDSDTWQYELSKRLNKRVTNFGVGNYGADQALLRLKQEYSSKPTKYVVLAFTPYTVTRITSVWKHFSEFGNVLAFKPRFVVEDKKLSLVPNIIQEKEMLSNNNNYKEHVARFDEHEGYIKKHTYHFPLLLSAMLKPEPFLQTLYQQAAKIFAKLKKMRLAVFCSNKFYRYEIEYRKKLYLKHQKLLQLIVDDFTSFASANDFKPMLLLLPAIEDVRYFAKSGDTYYSNIVATNGLEIFDFMEGLTQADVPNDYFVDSVWGGHYSVSGNKKLAEFLEKKLHEINIEV